MNNTTVAKGAMHFLEKGGGDYKSERHQLIRTMFSITFL